MAGARLRSLALALLATWSAVALGDGKAPAAPPPVPSILFVALNVADLDRSIDFYTRVIGMRETQRFGGDGSRGEPVEVVLALGDAARGATLLLVHSPGQSARRELGNGFSRVALAVPDVSSLVAKVQAAGHAVKLPRKEIPEVGVVVAMVTDPDGYTVELIEFTGGARR